MTFKRVLLAVLLAAGLVLGTSPARADVTDSTGNNVQDGDNSADATQGGASASGDAVGGLVTGIVSSGDTSVDAKNRSEDVDVESGEAHGTNDSASVTGLAQSLNDDITVFADVEGVDGDELNVQDGDNDFSLTQSANASSGDAVGGAVIGAVVSAGGSADIVADNSSKDVDVVTGEADADTRSDSLVGLAFNEGEVGAIFVGTDDVTDITSNDDANVQDGDNTGDASQTVSAASGDGVAGEVIGVVSAGDTSIDAKNAGDDVDIDTGLATADASAGALVGEAFTEDGQIRVEASDVSGIDASHLNVQDGDNDASIVQTSDAATGDGVGGQVIGAVTSAGGSADIVADNGSEHVDISTGEANGRVEAGEFIGLANGGDEVHAGDIDDSTSGDANLQDGDNSDDVTQSAAATSGDGVGGQVIGAVSAGNTSIDAKNRSEDVDVDTGLADVFEESDGLVGLGQSQGDEVDVGDVGAVEGVTTDHANIQDGDNDRAVDQTATATTGDGVGGQVIGAVTSAGGSADITADNSSKDVDVASDEAGAFNDAEALVGHANADEQVDIDDVSNVTANNDASVQDGDNSEDVSQAATASSGDGVAGQVIGVVSAGDTRVDAKNSSEDVDIDTGEASADNDSVALVGHGFSDDDDVNISDVTQIDVSGHANVQDGDNDRSVDQTATATTGDGVGGQVIGAVTSAGGSADIVADNASEDVDIATGAADATNSTDAIVGLANADGEPGEVTVGSDVDEIDTSGDANVQDGDNSQDITQSATASSGDGVGGQVIGAVSAGRTSIDAKNRSEDVDVDTGSALAANISTQIVGQAFSEEENIEVGLGDVSNIDIGDHANVQDGDNDQTLDQTAEATTGDGVGGQVIGAVTSAGGSADIVADNASEDVDIETGTADATNTSHAFVGLANADDLVDVGDVSNIDVSNEANVQDGDNSMDLAQNATASSGDGVGGQVLGVVSAGDASLDAKNRSEDVDLESGPADGSNNADLFVGQALSRDDNVEIGDIDDTDAENLQDGDNGFSGDQNADASSGDAVGGQVAGVVTSSGGSADAVLDNDSQDIDATSGSGDFTNDDALFVGEVFTPDELIVG